MKELVNTYINLTFKTGIILLILSSFFLFTNLTTEFYDTAKFIILVIFTSLLLLLLTLKFALNNKVVLTRTPLDIPLLLLLAVAAVSTILSPSPYISLLGSQIRIHGSLVSLIFYVLFYFVLVNNFKNLKEIKWILHLSLVAAQILAVISLVSYAGVKILPPPWTAGINFTPTGSSFSTTAVLAMLLPIPVAQILSSHNLITKVINSVFLTLMGITIALTGSYATWVAAIFALGLTFFVNNLSNLRDLSNLDFSRLISLISLIIPLTIVALVVILSFVPPVKGVKNPIYTQAQNFPREIQLGFITSWKIAVSSFRDVPFWGTGPATFLFNFTNYKPIEFNSSKEWNLRFDSAFNEYLQVLSTLGGVGLIAILSLTAMYISSVSEMLSPSPLQGKYDLKQALSIGGLTFFVILALHPSTLVVWVIGILILSSIMFLNLSYGLPKSWGSSQDLKEMLIKIATNVSSRESSQETIRIEALPSILLTIASAAILGVFFFGGKIVIADYHHKKALNAVAQNNGIVAYNELVRAEKLNGVNDLYRTDLAQINFALANAIATAKGPNEASQQGSLTDTDKLNIQNLLQQSINEGRNATTLSPRSAINWEILGLLYRQIAGVAQNALVFSLDSYGRAIFQDPLNPVLRLNVGGVYYAIKNYDLAIRFFTDSINLKPDFANGYYNLSVALKDKGDLNSAITAAQKVVELVDKNSQDYKLASDYLDDLKSKAEVSTQPPAATTSGTLQNEKLPKVLNVGTPEKIATPEAIKKPNPSPTTNP